VRFLDSFRSGFEEKPLISPETFKNRGSRKNVVGIPTLRNETINLIKIDIQFECLECHFGQNGTVCNAKSGALGDGWGNQRW
jgi:hypothetical protein